MTATDQSTASSVDHRREQPDVEIVIPVYNEEAGLERSIHRLHEFLVEQFPFSYRITIADNASTDSTLLIANVLSAQLSNVNVIHLDQKGRGRALQAAWARSNAAVLAYMDVDLSTDLAALLPLVAPLLSGHSDISIGSRLTDNARVLRGPKRETISRCYNVLLHSTLGSRFSDAQCGFKAIRADRARALLPQVKDTEWFFDTELLVLAEREGMRIHEVPVDWVDDPDSRVEIIPTAVADLKGIWRLIRTKGSAADTAETPGLRPQIMRFVIIGVLSTIAYALLFLLAREVAGAQIANAFALVMTAVLNTAANRRFTFGVRGRRHVARHQLQGLAIFALGLLITSGSLALLHLLSPGVSTTTELVVLTAANLVATLSRFVLFRSWVFRKGGN